LSIDAGHVHSEPALQTMSEREAAQGRVEITQKEQCGPRTPDARTSVRGTIAGAELARDAQLQRLLRPV
jgi:hypothetical protein